MPTASPPNPAGLEQIEAQKRAVARREKEKAAAEAAELKAKADDAAAAASQEAIAKAKADLLPKVTELRRDLQKAADKARIAVIKRKEEIAKVESTIGNLEGAIITAGDLARRDPQRALDTLTRAKAAFEKAVK